MKKLILGALSALAFLFIACTPSTGGNGTGNIKDNNWLSDEVPSIKDTYKDIFDSFGIACEYSSWNGIKELSVQTVCDGLKKHANSITMGNEFKPDSFLSNLSQWAQSTPKLVDFTASNGKTIKVPETLVYTTVDNCLSACVKNGLKMRGHVLVWHSQTPDNFFAEDYKAIANGDLISNLVDKETMTARQEWYIKSVLNHVAEWEAANNNGEHVVWAWDVVNEAMADDASTTTWVRGTTNNTKDKSPASGGSRWCQIYGNDDFIINAFRFANAYAPADVKLCYNDYNEYMGEKTNAILKTINKIKTAEAQTINGKSVAPRIDVMGMQSHIGVNWPGVSGYESALKRYLEVVDVHVTEFDVSATSSKESKTTYSDYFKMLKKYGKNYSGDHKVQNVTVWGINNKTSWIYKGNTKYPLLFDNFETTPSFDAVIEAAGN